jgi:hypothetical protein
MAIFENAGMYSLALSQQNSFKLCFLSIWVLFTFDLQTFCERECHVFCSVAVENPYKEQIIACLLWVIYRLSPLS